MKLFSVLLLLLFSTKLSSFVGMPTSESEIPRHIKEKICAILKSQYNNLAKIKGGDVITSSSSSSSSSATTRATHKGDKLKTPIDEMLGIIESELNTPLCNGLIAWQQQNDTTRCHFAQDHLNSLNNLIGFFFGIQQYYRPSAFRHSPEKVTRLCKTLEELKDSAATERDKEAYPEMFCQFYEDEKNRVDAQAVQQIKTTLRSEGKSIFLDDTGKIYAIEENNEDQEFTADDALRAAFTGAAEGVAAELPSFSDVLIETAIQGNTKIDIMEQTAKDQMDREAFFKQYWEHQNSIWMLYSNPFAMPPIYSGGAFY